MWVNMQRNMQAEIIRGRKEVLKHGKEKTKEEKDSKEKGKEGS